MDTLFILKPGSENPAYPGKIFYCWHCALIEGIMASFPQLGSNLAVRRIEWPKPRTEVIQLAGEQNQSVPLLVLSEGASSRYQTGSYGGRVLIAEKDALLAALTERHGFPETYP
jgi:hypothetical protein